MRIGLIAGSGQFPLIFSKAAKSSGFSVHAIGLIHETDSDIEKFVDAFEWVHIGQVERMIQFFKKSGIKEAVLLGAVDKTHMFGDVKPDMTAISIVAGMNHTQDDALLRAFAKTLEEKGIMIRSSTLLLPELLASSGCWTKRKPTSAEKTDIIWGYSVAKKIGDLDIGQSVVVSGGSVLAVEAIDGTDATIKRGGRLARDGAVVVKTSKPGQDMRFDVPAVGIETVKVMKSAHITALAVEAGKTVVFDREEMVALADKCSMVIIAIDDEFLKNG